LRGYHDALPNSIHVFQEGSSRFVERRIVALHDVERHLFLAASNYLRALGLLVSSAAPWAHVTLYYASFFAAKALVGMFGGWIDGSKRIVEVQASTPGAQVLVLRRNVKAPNGYQGSHRAFWDFFYDAVRCVQPWVDPQWSLALVPVNGDRAWQISARNEVNYDTRVAFDVVAKFPTALDRKNFRNSLTGPVATQLQVTEAMLLVAFKFARELHVESQVFSPFEGGKRGACIQALIVDAGLPELIAQSRINTLAS